MNFYEQQSFFLIAQPHEIHKPMGINEEHIDRKPV